MLDPLAVEHLDNRLYLIDKKTTLDFQTIALNSLAIRLRSEDLHHLILGNKVPELQG